LLFVDSSDPAEIEDLFGWGTFSGVTTNPLMLSREAPSAELEPQIRRVLAASQGHVSVELLAETEGEMLTEALRYHAWNTERMCIKVPFSEIGLRVARRLVERGIAVNVTCMMSFNQAYLAALGGATYVSLFAGRIRDMGYDVRPIIRELRAAVDREELESKILIGSVRQLMDVTEAVQDGAHVVTVPPAILRKMLWNPQTESTIREFSDAWHQRKP
jgi:transaldolase